ncbi:MAG: DAPG hydrolase family protein [Candidatus Lokiarchaeia archaeon]
MILIKMPESETVDLVVDHELQGVTPKMLDWWWDHIDTTERYKLWHPKDHKSFRWEVSPKKGHIGAIHLVMEEIGGNPTALRIRWEDPSSVPISTTYSHVNAASILDDDDKPFSWLVCEYEATQNGTRMRSTYRLPAGVPQRFIEGLRKHDQEEMANLPEFLPELYKKENK